MASTPEDGGPLRVGANTSPQSLATAIMRSIEATHTFPSLRAIGHGAVGQTVKGIAIARGFAAVKGMDLAVIVGFDTIQNDQGEDISAMHFQIFQR